MTVFFLKGNLFLYGNVRKVMVRPTVPVEKNGVPCNSLSEMAACQSGTTGQKR